MWHNSVNEFLRLVTCHKCLFSMTSKSSHKAHQLRLRLNIPWRIVQNLLQELWVAFSGHSVIHFHQIECELLQCFALHISLFHLLDNYLDQWNFAPIKKTHEWPVRAFRLFNWFISLRPLKMLVNCVLSVHLHDLTHVELYKSHCCRWDFSIDTQL